MKKNALLIGLVLTLGACKTPGEDVDVSTVPCLCGQPKAMFEGCSNPKCLSGEGNPDNPDCVCGPLFIREDN